MTYIKESRCECINCEHGQTFRCKVQEKKKKKEVIVCQARGRENAACSFCKSNHDSRIYEHCKSFIPYKYIIPRKKSIMARLSD